MLIKVTNKCSLGCSHCLEDSTVQGSPMSWETFLQALDLTRRVESLVWSQGIPPRILLSGGECTEHPEIVPMVEEVYRQGLLPMLLTNGMWLENETLRSALLRPEWPDLLIQVTNDPRFYPKAPPQNPDPRLIYVPEITVISKLGRAARRNDLSKWVSTRMSPASFNLRSMTKHFRSIEEAVAMLRIRSIVGKSGSCIPSISSDGSVVAGESRFCWKIGDVTSSNEELTRALLDMKSCNRCGDEANLTLEHRRAIGIL